MRGCSLLSMYLSQKNSERGKKAASLKHMKVAQILSDIKNHDICQKAVRILR